MVYWQVIVLIKQTFFMGVFLLFLLCTPVQAKEPPQISAKSAVLYDPLSCQILYAKNEQEVLGMASTTKIMTALVALEQYDLQQDVIVEKAWTGIEGSSMYLKAGEKLTVSDLLYGLLLSSGNDAAAALAGLDPDGEEAFVEKMNQKAALLGLENTHFENPSGLDGETHHTTALELAKIAACALENEIFAKMVATQQIQVAGRWLKNHNRLLKEIDACGVKTGYTKACGRCLVSAKEQNGRQLICVTLNAPDDWLDHKSLFDYGFSQYECIDITGAGDCGSVPLISSKKKASRLYTTESCSVWMTQEEQKSVRIQLIGPRFWYGSVVAGQPYGTMRVSMNDRVIFETPVYFADTSQASGPEPSLWERLKQYLFRR